MSMKLQTNKHLRVAILFLLISACALVLCVRQLIRARVASPPNPASRDVLKALPNTILWAWERPERLDYIDTKRIGVAYLAKTIRLSDNGLNVRPRLQPLILAEDAKVIAVVRIESDHRGTIVLSQKQLEETAKQIAEVGQLPGVLGVQIDFDATVSQRNFYRQLLFKIREQLASSTALSMTALASWCAGDKWLSDLPVDEVVPMMFRLGIDRAEFVSRLQSNKEYFQEPCDQSAGVSTDEVIPAPQRNRLYIFSPKPWTANAVNDALETYCR